MTNFEGYVQHYWNVSSMFYGVVRSQLTVGEGLQSLHAIMRTAISPHDQSLRDFHRAFRRLRGRAETLTLDIVHNNRNPEKRNDIG